MIAAAPVHSKQDVLDRLRRNHARLEQYGVRRFGLFGSFVRDEAGPDSDVDLLVEFKPDQETFDNFMGLSFYLEDLLGRRVQIASSDWLSPYIGPHILREVEYAPLDA